MTFREKLDGKVWKAVQAMIDGLKNQDERSYFVINMGSYGDASRNICYGCAATCTIQEITNKNFKKGENIISAGNRAEYLKMPLHDLKIFENAIDDLRGGDAFTIFDYMRKDYTYNLHTILPVLHTGDWKFRISRYQDFANKLKALDI